MPYEQKDGSGALFKNNRKEKDTHPDYRGDAKINGQDYWLSAWIKEGKNGKFFSLSIQPKEERRVPQRFKSADAGLPEDRGNLDDEIPF